MNFVSALVAGLLFGSGLLMSGMTDPQRVLGFLDVAGDWNPALMFTMGGAIATAAPAFWLGRRRKKTLRGEPIELPDRHRIDARLLGGSSLFGVGWGLSGLCPGPALIVLTGFSPQALVFGVCLLVGMLASALVARSRLRLSG